MNTNLIQIKIKNEKYESIIKTLISKSIYYQDLEVKENEILLKINNDFILLGINGLYFWKK